MFLLPENETFIQRLQVLTLRVHDVKLPVSITGERVAISTKSYTLILGVSYYILLYSMEQRLKASSARQLEQHCIHTRDMPQHSTITQSKYIHKLSIWSSIEAANISHHRHPSTHLHVREGLRYLLVTPQYLTSVRNDVGAQTSTCNCILLLQ